MKKEQKEEIEAGDAPGIGGVLIGLALRGEDDDGDLGVAED